MGRPSRQVPLASLLLVFACSSSDGGGSPSLADGATDDGSAGLAGSFADGGPVAGTAGAALVSDAAARSDGSDVATSTGDAAATKDGAISAVACGRARPDPTAIRGSVGLTIGRDGTIYFTQSSGIGRARPGAAAEPSWITLSGVTAVWGLTLDRAGQTLFAASPYNHTIYGVDVTGGQATVSVVLGDVPRPNGLATGADGALYFVDQQGGHVYRFADGVRSFVTKTPIPGGAIGPTGLAFDSSGRLYVGAPPSRVVRLTLVGGMESERVEIVSDPELSLSRYVNGVAFDAAGNIYVSTFPAGSVWRYDPNGLHRQPLAGIVAIDAPSFALMAFGVGALGCSDLYVASSGPIEIVPTDTPGLPLPWQRP